MKHKPHKKIIKNNKPSTLYYMVLSVAIIEPLMTLPQTIKVWNTQSAGDLSLATWAFYFVASVIWLAYGIRIKDKPLITASALWVSMYIPVIAAILLFGAQS